MTDTEVAVQPEAVVPTVATPRRRAPARAATPVVPSSPAAIEVLAPTTMADMEASVAPTADASPAVSSEPRPAPTRRARQATAATGFPWDVSPLATVPTDELLAEIERRRQRARTLLAEREKIRTQIARIDAELAAMRVAIPVAPDAAVRSRAPRAKNDVTLADAIAQAVEVRATVSPSEVAELVLANGYRTTSKTFNAAVATALAQDSRFQRTGRGQYQRLT